MSYLLIFDNYTIRYLDTSKFLDGNSIPLDVLILRQEFNQMFIQSRINLYRKKQGYIQSKYGHLYYTESSNHFPTRFNNYGFSDETFPISNSGSIYNVFTFMHQDGSPIAFMFLVENKNWNFHQLDGTDVIIGNEPHEEIFQFEDTDTIVLEHTPERLLNLSFIDEHYFCRYQKKPLHFFFIIDDDNNIKTLTENIRLDPTKTYRFLYREEYMFVIGGDILLYGKI